MGFHSFIHSFFFFFQPSINYYMVYSRVYLFQDIYIIDQVKGIRVRLYK